MGSGSFILLQRQLATCEHEWRYQAETVSQNLGMSETNRSCGKWGKQIKDWREKNCSQRKGAERKKRLCLGESYWISSLQDTKWCRAWWDDHMPCWRETQRYSNRGTSSTVQFLVKARSREWPVAIHGWVCHSWRSKEEARERRCKAAGSRE